MAFKIAQPMVSILAEVPEELHEVMKRFLDRNQDWDHDRVFAAALSLFLMQNSPAQPGNAEEFSAYRQAARTYLDSLFRQELE